MGSGNDLGISSHVRARSGNDGNQVLKAFRHDAPSLFFGAVIVTMGLDAVAFCALRRKYDPLLIYLALLARLYGRRMWVKSDLLSLTMPGSYFFPRLRSAIDFVIPIPPFLFLDAGGFLHRRTRNATYVLAIGTGLLALATLALGPRDLFYRDNGVLKSSSP